MKKGTCQFHLLPITSDQFSIHGKPSSGTQLDKLIKTTVLSLILNMHYSFQQVLKF